MLGQRLWALGLAVSGVMAGILTSCAWEYGGSDSVSVSFKVSKKQIDPMRPIFSVLNIEPPTDINSFDCFALNVVGRGVAPTVDFLTWAQRLVDAAIDNNTHCTYMGATSPIVAVGASGSGTLTARVPPGQRRLVQVLGLRQSAAGACPTVPFQTVAQSPGTYGIDAIVEVGRAQVDLTKDTVVPLANVYSQTGSFRDLAACDDYSTLALSDASLTAYWRMNGGSMGASSTQVLSNYVGNWGHLTMNSESGLAPVAGAVVGNDMAMPMLPGPSTGNYASVALPASASLPPTGYTVVSWIKAVTLTASKTIWKMGSGYNSMMLSVGGTADQLVLTQTTPPSNSYATTATAVTSGSWMMVTAVYEYVSGTAAAKLYVNGNQTPIQTIAVGSPLAGSLNLNSGPLYLGRSAAPNTDAITADMDDFSVYSRTLTPAEIAHLYNVATGAEAP